MAKDLDTSCSLLKLQGNSQKLGYRLSTHHCGETAQTGHEERTGSCVWNPPCTGSLCRSPKTRLCCSAQVQGEDSAAAAWTSGGRKVRHCVLQSLGAWKRVFECSESTGRLWRICYKLLHFFLIPYSQSRGEENPIPCRCLHVFEHKQKAWFGAEFPWCQNGVSGIISVKLPGFARLLVHWKCALLLTGLDFYRWRAGQSSAPSEHSRNLCQLANLTVWNIRGEKAWRYWFCSCRVSACRCFCQENWLKLGFLRYFNPIWTKPHKKRALVLSAWAKEHIVPHSYVYMVTLLQRDKSPQVSSLHDCPWVSSINQTLSVAGLRCTAAGTMMLLWVKRWEDFVASSFVQVWKYKPGLLQSFSSFCIHKQFL